MSDHYKGREDAPIFTRPENPVHKLVIEARKKIQNYESKRPTELLFYTYERTDMPVDVLVPQFHHYFGEADPYERVWLLGWMDEFCEIILPYNQFLVQRIR